MITVIIPFYNRFHFIAHLLDQYCASDFSFIFVNDQSTDSFEDLITQYSKYSNIKFVDNFNKGVSNARNLGIYLADTEYVVFLDSDDFIPIESLTARLASILKNGNDIEIYNAEVKVENVTVRLFNNSKYKFRLERILLFDSVIPMNGLIIKRSFLLNNKVLFCTNLNNYEDLHFYFQMLCLNPSYQVFNQPDCIVNEHRIERLSTTREYHFVEFVKFKRLVLQLKNSHLVTILLRYKELRLLSQFKKISITQRVEFIFYNRILIKGIKKLYFNA